jgi:hypothetical protein
MLECNDPHDSDTGDTAQIISRAIRMRGSKSEAYTKPPAKTPVSPILTFLFVLSAQIVGMGSRRIAISVIML